MYLNWVSVPFYLYMYILYMYMCLLSYHDRWNILSIFWTKLMYPSRRRAFVTDSARSSSSKLLICATGNIRCCTFHANHVAPVYLLCLLLGLLRAARSSCFLVSSHVNPSLTSRPFKCKGRWLIMKSLEKLTPFCWRLARWMCLLSLYFICT